MSRQERRKIFIIGAGIVGVSTAIWLQRAGHDVTLVDKAGPGEGTSYGNGGVLASCAVVPVTGPGLLPKAPFMLLDPDQPLYLRWRYLPKLLPWLIRYLKHNNEADTRRIAQALAPIIGDSLEDHLALARGTRAEKFIVPGDYVYVYKKRSDFEAEALSWDIRREAGFTWREIGHDELAGYADGISDTFQFGISLPGHGRITDPGAYVKALADSAISAGGRLIQGAVTHFDFQDGRVCGLEIDGIRHDVDAVVIAAGIWSVPLLEKLGMNVPVETERGYHIELINPTAMPKAPLMLSSGKFVVTPMEGRIRCAGVLEFGGLELGPSRAPLDMLERQFRQAFPDISWERTESWMGHRPAPADSIPLIGELGEAKGVFTGFGHHHIGLTGGPKTGRLIARLASGERPNMDMKAYSPLRY